MSMTGLASAWAMARRRTKGYRHKVDAATRCSGVSPYLTYLTSVTLFQEIADPFYAYCKQHADKYAMKAKRRNYLAIQSHIKSHHSNDGSSTNQDKVSLGLTNREEVSLE